MFRLALIKFSKPADNMQMSYTSTSEPPDFSKKHLRLYYGCSSMRYAVKILAIIVASLGQVKIVVTLVVVKSNVSLLYLIVMHKVIKGILFVFQVLLISSI
jgi:hypothetical protein